MGAQRTGPKREHGFCSRVCAGEQGCPRREWAAQGPALVGCRAPSGWSQAGDRTGGSER